MCAIYISYLQCDPDELLAELHTQRRPASLLQLNLRYWARSVGREWVVTGQANYVHGQPVSGLLHHCCCTADEAGGGLHTRHLAFRPPPTYVRRSDICACVNWTDCDCSPGQLSSPTECRTGLRESAGWCVECRYAKTRFIEVFRDVELCRQSWHDVYCYVDIERIRRSAGGKDFLTVL